MTCFLNIIYVSVLLPLHYNQSRYFGSLKYPYRTVIFVKISATLLAPSLNTNNPLFLTCTFHHLHWHNNTGTCITFRNTKINFKVRHCRYAFILEHQTGSVPDSVQCTNKALHMRYGY